MTRADPDTLDLLLTEARTHYGWQDRPVADETLREMYDIAKMGPTSMNQQPMRILFIRSAEAKAKLEPLMMEGNRAKTMSAPVVAIVGYDTNFYEKLPELFPPVPKAKQMYEGNDAMIEDHGFRNGTLQAAYLMIAARAVGLDVGPMSGFDKGGVDAAFFAGTAIKTNFIINLGYADEDKLFRRLPRIPFEEATTTV
ncbi:malonic semialdehyde reductase [Acuticoccus sp. MNP-M23]|uniref:malonic semialdehyde reductase n=1 Tax=Acuticoccus sp. MNP-M23 TaxID=3072793 RepID=UPI0028169447|nr:malonic semialdehyde reductase [Acuticoccus sp. MNP-M23]WMS44996.1 malonic semialdehyde reductase [Acuticoccus sp. MNP-M23]